MSKPASQPILGRKRQLGDRYPSGKLKPAEKQPGTPPAKIRRIVDLAMNAAADPMLATAVGWLRLHRVLTDTQTAAALAYAKLQGQYDSAMGIPRRSVASPSYGAGFGRDNGREQDEKALASLKRKYTALREVVKNSGPRSLGIMDRTCVEDLQPPLFETPDLISILSAVAKHLGMTK